MIPAILLFVILIVLDQAAKYLAVIHLLPVDSITLIPGILNLTYVENRGAAFGLFQGGRWFFVIITVIIMAGIIWYYIKLPKSKYHNLLRFTLVLIASGAVGNFIDRFRNGYVVDYLQAAFINFPVFNIADSCVVVGTILFAILLLFENRFTHE